MSSPSLPGATGAFLLDIDAAAGVLDVSPTRLVDLVRAGCVSALLVRPSDTTDRPPLRFAPDLLIRDHELLRTADHVHRVAEVDAVATALRAYLAACPPTADYDAALAGDLPVLARNRQAEPCAHIRADVLQARIQPDRRPGEPDGALVLPSRMAWALSRLGCVRRNGLRPMGGGPQRWEAWWRVPMWFWPDPGTDTVADWPALADGASW
jgi:hypothetical protein